MKKFGTVIVRLVPVKHQGNLTHDWDNDKRPGYVNKNNSHLNTVIVGTNLQDARALYSIQKNSMIEDFNLEKNHLRELLNQQSLPPKEMTKERSKIRNWQSHMCSHMSGLIGFGLDADAKLLNPSTMDACAKAYLKDFCERHHVEALYLIRHMDESNPHYQFVTTNYNSSKKQTLRLNRDDLRQEQDSIGNAFTKLGLRRGIDKQERLKQASNKLNQPAINGKYSAEVWKEANVIHRSVKQLHEDLPLEVEAKKEEIQALNDAIEKQHKKLIKNQELLRSNEYKLGLIKQDEMNRTEEIAKITKRMSSYEKRCQDAQTEIDKLSLKINPPKPTRVKRVKSYKKGFLTDTPIFAVEDFVTVNEANKTYKSVRAKEIKQKQDYDAKYAELQETEKKILQDKAAAELFIKNQLYKHYLVYGDIPTDLATMTEFLRWVDQDTGWNTTENGTRFKVHKESGVIKRVVVDNTTGHTPAEMAFTLLCATQQAKFMQAIYSGPDSVLIEFWKLNEISEEPIQINLTENQVLTLERNGLIVCDNSPLN